MVVIYLISVIVSSGPVRRFSKRHFEKDAGWKAAAPGNEDQWPGAGHRLSERKSNSKAHQSLGEGGCLCPSLGLRSLEEHVIYLLGPVSMDRACSGVATAMFVVPEDDIRSLLADRSKAGRWRTALDRITPDNPAGLEHVALLIRACRTDPDALGAVVTHAGRLKSEIFGPAVKLFVPVYISNTCVNECLYCAYRAPNVEMPRRTLTEDEFRREVLEVTGMGYRVIELVTSESIELQEPGRLARYISIAREVLDQAPASGDAPEVILMSWALSDEEFAAVRDAGVDAFYLWQETYDRRAYAAVHPEHVPKADFDWRVVVFDRAMQAGIRKVGLGILFGIGGWEFDVLALIAHGRYLEKEYGAPPDALGLPRFKHAQGIPIRDAPHPVSDDQLRLAVALYRLAFPCSHVFLNTREKLSLLLKLLEGGGSEMNIACAVFPGGYTEPVRDRQFDHYSYPTDKTVAMLANRGYRPTHFLAPTAQ